MIAFHENRSYTNNLEMNIVITKEMDFLAHWHSEVELIYVLDGSQQICINKEIQVLEKGDFAICGSGDIHYYIGANDYAKQILTIFKPNLIGYNVEWPQQMRFVNPIIKRSSFNNNEDVITAMNRIEKLLLDSHKEFKMKKVGFQDYIKSMLLEVCVLAIRNFPTINVDALESNFIQYNLDRMQKVLQFIEGNYTRNINLEELATQANLSYFHFSRIFKNTVGMSFKEYINKRRLQQAEILLKMESISITQIAFECGFESIRTFYRTYKAFTGTTPGKNKKKII